MSWVPMRLFSGAWVGNLKLIDPHLRDLHLHSSFPNAGGQHQPMPRKRQLAAPQVPRKRRLAPPQVAFGPTAGGV